MRALVPADTRSDEELAAASADGDADALAVLLDRHADRIHGICRRVLTNPDDALDATQEALIAVTRKIDRFDARARFTTWLYRVATNAAIDEARRRARRPRPVEVLPERSEGDDFGSRIADRLVVDAAMAEIPVEFRAAVALRDLADLDYAQIAEILDVPPGTVRSRIARGRSALAATLGNQAGPSDRPTNEPQ